MSLNFPSPPAWTERALCAQTDPAIFFPEKGDTYTAAKRVCAACPVRDECAAYCLANGDQYGIWAGVTASTISRTGGDMSKLQPITHGTPTGYKAHRRRGEKACDECTEANRVASEERRVRNAAARRAKRAA